MNYSAKKIYILSDRMVVDVWAKYMIEHREEVRQALAQESVRHEMWFIGSDADGLFVIGVMDVDDAKNSVVVSNSSPLGVDRVHREFKTYWDKSRMLTLDIDRARAPDFPECELIFEGRAS